MNNKDFEQFKADVRGLIDDTDRLRAQIATLTAENKRLREALNKIEDGTAFSLVHPVPIYGMGSDLEDGYFIAADFARAALQPEEGEG